MQPVHILYGTETYNSQDLAERTGEAIQARGIPAVVLDMEDFDHGLLPSLSVLLIITSTFGAGEPPSNAEELHEYLMDGGAPPLPDLKFGVCGLGDTAYEDFCECGKEFDRRLEELGATRIVPRQDCDTDFEEPWDQWLQQALAALASVDLSAAPPPPAPPPPVPQPAPTPKPKPKKIGTKKNPFFATVIENYNLNHPTSKKETRHVALSLEGSGIEYKAGDSLGIFPRNCPDLVRRVLSAVGIPRDTPVQHDGEWFTIRDVCIYKRDVMQIDRKMLAMAEVARNANRFAPILADKKLQTKYIADHQLIDFVQAADLQPEPQAFVDALRPLAPRLYSIASSPNAHPGEVHLCVDVLRYELFGSMRKGVSSTFLGERAGPGVEIAVYLHETKDFILCDDHIPVILIGPGTGIAPMRAFLEERETRKSPGQSWLFFGAQHEATDFLYRDQLEGFVKSGRLARLDTAFSRDQEHKVYVQNRMYEARTAIWAWLEAGAYIYICGDASRMAKDVNDMLCTIVRECGGYDSAGAEGYVRQLSKSKRYLKDVY